MLFYKAWLETRTRFLAGAAMIAALSAFFVFANPWIIRQWQMEQLAQPQRVFAAWSYRAQSDYAFFTWHFLYGYMLQQLMAVFGVLLGLGGMRHEQARGTALFTLSLPRTRRQLFLARALTGLAQIATLAIIAGAVLHFASPLIGKLYSLPQAVWHTLLLIAGGCFWYLVGVFVSTVIKGEHAPTLVAVSLVAFLYFVIQPYVDGPVPPAFIRVLNLPALVAGAPYINALRDVSWNGLLVVSLLGAAMLWSSALIFDKSDY